METFNGREGDSNYVPPYKIAARLEDEWDAIYPRLLAFTLRYSSYLRNLGNTAWTAEDLIAEAVTRILEGRKKWNKEKCPELIEFLFGAIRSIRSDVKKQTMSAIGYGLTDLGDAEDACPSNPIAMPATTPEEEAAAGEFIQRFRAWVDEEFPDDEGVQWVVECLLDGVFDPIGISNMSDMSVADVNNALKRLRRRAKNSLARDDY